MLSASKYVKFYEDSNPQWFENNFGSTKDLNPLCERKVSIVKPQTTPDRLDSVSQQGSSPSSPTEHDHLLVPIKHAPSVTSDIIDMLSCRTINEMHERVVEKKQQSGLDDFSFIPPESASQMLCENISTALANINNHSDDEVVDTDEDFFQRTINPPLNPLDIQVDSVSSALADINTNSDTMFFKGGSSKFVFEDEAMGSSVSQFDCVSL